MPIIILVNRIPYCSNCVIIKNHLIIASYFAIHKHKTNVNCVWWNTLISCLLGRQENPPPLHIRQFVVRTDSHTHTHAHNYTMISRSGRPNGPAIEHTGLGTDSSFSSASFTFVQCYCQVWKRGCSLAQPIWISSFCSKYVFNTQIIPYQFLFSVVHIIISMWPFLLNFRIGIRNWTSTIYLFDFRLYINIMRYWPRLNNTEWRRV